MTKPMMKSPRRAHTVSYQALLDLETRPVPDILRVDQPSLLPLKDIAASRYTSQAFFDLEVEKMWMRTWQFTCRDEEIPEPGDTHVFNLLDKSVLIVRQEDGSVKAMQNVCLHRGRRLMTVDGQRKSFKCPYHGFTWNADGSFAGCPMQWDFPQIDPENFSLREIRLENWAGFNFINFDSDAPPLIEELHPLPTHFAHWNIEDYYKAAHVGKVMDGNWKAVTEAFLEASHVATTHPQVAMFTGDGNTQYDLLSPNVDRMITALGQASPQLDFGELSENDLFKKMLLVGTRAGMGRTDVELPEGMSARAQAAEMSREKLQEENGYDYSGATDSEVMDGFSYQFFPNFGLWGGMGTKTLYRWRPINVDQTLMEVILLKRHPKGTKGEPVPYRELGGGETWASATELGYLSGVYDQDESNMPLIQAGLRDLGDHPIQLGVYSELRCRHLHQRIDDFLEQ